MFNVEREVLCGCSGKKGLVWELKENLESGDWEKESNDEQLGMFNTLISN